MTRLRHVPGKDGEPAKWVPVERGQPLLHFKPFETGQLSRAQAEGIGAHFDERDGVTSITSERQLREHMAAEKAAGRDVRWREH